MTQARTVDLLAQMATFVRVVDAQSLSAAGRALRLSLPAVSRQLSALESELGASLIVRSTRKLHVTDAGREWYQRSVRILREVDEARNAVRSTKGVRGTLVVSASLTFGLVVVVPKLAALATEYPQLTVDLRLEDRLVDLVGEGVDLAVRAGSPPPDSTTFVAYPILSMRRVLVAAPRWLRENGFPREPRELAKRDCLVQVTPAGNLVHWVLQRGDASETVDVRGRTRTNAPIALRDLAVCGGGIAYLPDWLVHDDLAQGRLARVLPEWSSAPIPAWAIHRTELRGSPRVRAFLDALAAPVISRPTGTPKSGSRTKRQ